MSQQGNPSSQDALPKDDRDRLDNEDDRNSDSADDRYRPDLDSRQSAYSQGGSQKADVISGTERSESTSPKTQ